MFSLIWAWINDWVNNREAGDLRRHRGHYDVNVMQFWHVTYRCSCKNIGTFEMTFSISFPIICILWGESNGHRGFPTQMAGGVELCCFLWWHLEQTTEQKKELSYRSLETSRRMIASSNWSIFRVTGALWGESTGHRWIPLTKASNAALWCFLWFAPEQTAEQPIETPVIWDAIALIMTSLQWPMSLRWMLWLKAPSYLLKR